MRILSLLIFAHFDKCIICLAYKCVDKTIFSISKLSLVLLSTFWPITFICLSDYRLRSNLEYLLSTANLEKCFKLKIDVSRFLKLSQIKSFSFFRILPNFIIFRFNLVIRLNYFSLNVQLCHSLGILKIDRLFLLMIRVFKLMKQARLPM